MIANITDHLANASKIKEAEAGGPTHNLLLIGFKGFVCQLSMISLSDPLKYTTVTCWQSNEDAEAWVHSDVHDASVAKVVGYFRAPPTREMFNVIPEISAIGHNVIRRLTKPAVAHSAVHWLRPEKLAEYIESNLKVNVMASKHKGFKSILTLAAQDNPNKIRIITMWETKKDIDAYVNSFEHLKGDGTDKGKEYADKYYWTQPVDEEYFRILPSYSRV